jgi:hypothetical protein
MHLESMWPNEYLDPKTQFNADFPSGNQNLLITSKNKVKN